MSENSCGQRFSMYTKKVKDWWLILGVTSMGYDLPAAVGACFGIGKKRTVCFSGDSSIQMNLQELQIIIHHDLAIKLFVINNVETVQ